MKLKGENNMRNWFDKNEGRNFNIILKLFGTLNIVFSLLCLFNIYHPSNFTNFTNMFLLGLIFLVFKYYPKEINKEEGK